MAGILLMGFVQGESRQQAALFPVCIEELVPAEHLVRVIDAWVSTLEMGRLGFAKAAPKGTGRPPYDPADLLKLYLYGYLNQVRSARKLERECQRNIEVLWLLNRLAPDFKTVANFRRENGAALAAVCRAFVCFCRAEQLISGELVAIDGSKFQAVASKKQVVSRRQLARELAAIDADIARYLAIAGRLPTGQRRRSYTVCSAGLLFGAPFDSLQTANACRLFDYPGRALEIWRSGNLGSWRLRGARSPQESRHQAKRALMRALTSRWPRSEQGTSCSRRRSSSCCSWLRSAAASVLEAA